MGNIKLLKIRLKSGLLTDLHSDTIFGHFCWRLKDLLGEEVLANFLSYFNEKKPIFSFSDAFPMRNNEIFLPQVITGVSFHNDRIIGNKNERIKDFLNNKKRKDKKFIDIDSLNLFLNAKIDDFERKLLRINSKNIPVFEGYARVSVEIDNDTFTAAHSKLFTYSPKYYINHSEQKDNLGNAIFVKVINTELFERYDCEAVIKDVFSAGFGKKKSSGYGEFEYIGFDDFEEFKEPEDANGFVTLGNYLPSADDHLTEKYYDFFVKYGKLGEEFALGPNPFKKPIVFIKPGSVFKTGIIKDWYGRCTLPGEISTIEKVVQCGIPFTLNCKIV